MNKLKKIIRKKNQKNRILFVDDGSVDVIGENSCDLHNIDERYVGIHWSKKQGHQNVVFRAIQLVCQAILSVYQLINIISGVKIVEGFGDFCMMRKEMLKAIIIVEEYNCFFKGIFGWSGFKMYRPLYKNVRRAGKCQNEDFGSCLGC